MRKSIVHNRRENCETVSIGPHKTEPIMDTYLNLHTPGSCVNQNDIKPSTIVHRDDTRGTAEATGKDSEGENGKNVGPGAIIASGLGGLGLEGIKGSVESVGASSEPPGEGKRGLISGERAGSGGEDKGGFGNNAGAAEIVEAGIFNKDALDKANDTKRFWHVKKITNQIKNSLVDMEVEAINDEEMKECLRELVL